MQWTVPQYSKDQLDTAGQMLISGVNVEEALSVVNNHRSSHAFPLNTMQMYLRGKARDISKDALVAQRIKRLPSIEWKLSRFKWLSLSSMQDIGGCRAVMPNARRVSMLVDAYHDSKIKHRLVKSDDYIWNPKKSGYRGQHLIYRYFSDHNETYNGLQIEIQIRSSLQHAWATAVETVGMFTNQALKSSEGEKDWLRFFALMSSVIAHREKRPFVPDTPEDYPELIAELKEYAIKLDVEGKLSAYRLAARATGSNPELKKARYFLLQLDSENRKIHIGAFTQSSFETASKAYLEAEQGVGRTASGDVVLVSVQSLDTLRKAYPNYFLDTSRFLREVRKVLQDS